MGEMCWTEKKKGKGPGGPGRGGNGQDQGLFPRPKKKNFRGTRRKKKGGVRTTYQG